MTSANDGSLNARYEFGPFGEPLRRIGETIAQENPFRCSTNRTDPISDWVHYECRVYNPNTGRWSNRDPIAERGGVNLYGCVENDPANTVDPLGEDFIAAGKRGAKVILGLRSHMSIEFYKQKCPGPNGEPSVGDRFKPSDVGNGKFTGAKRKGQWELIPTSGDYGWQIGNSRFNNPIWNIWIHATSTAEELVVVYADTAGKSDSAPQWKKVDGAATSYAYAEQLPVGQPLKNWPNFQYQLPPANNSNTFSHSMAAAIGASAAVFSDTPGAATPVPTPNTDPTPPYIGGICTWP